MSYRDALDPLGDLCVRYFASFAEARQQMADERLSECSIGRVSLEDVYFTLTGDPFDKGDARVKPSDIFFAA